MSESMSPNASASEGALVNAAADVLRAIAALIERPPLDDVELSQSVALRLASSITIVLGALADGNGTGNPISVSQQVTVPKTPADWTQLLSESLGASSAGCWRCGALAPVLARILSLQGHAAKVARGVANGIDHLWVEIDGVIYDPTVGQFTAPVSYTKTGIASCDESEGSVVRRNHGAREGELSEALEPFARLLDWYVQGTPDNLLVAGNANGVGDSIVVTVADLRRARAALSAGGTA